MAPRSWSRRPSLTTPRPSFRRRSSSVAIARRWSPARHVMLPSDRNLDSQRTHRLMRPSATSTRSAASPHHPSSPRGTTSPPSPSAISVPRTATSLWRRPPVAAPCGERRHDLRPLRNAARVRANKLRTFLTWLGMTIGVGLAIALLTIGAASPDQPRIRSIGQNPSDLAGGDQQRGLRAKRRGSPGTIFDLVSGTARRRAHRTPRLGVGHRKVPPTSTSPRRSSARRRTISTSACGPSPADALSDAESSAGRMVCAMGQTVRDKLFGVADPSASGALTGAASRSSTSRTYRAGIVRLGRGRPHHPSGCLSAPLPLATTTSTSPGQPMAANKDDVAAHDGRRAAVLRQASPQRGCRRQARTDFHHAGRPCRRRGHLVLG